MTAPPDGSPDGTTDGTTDDSPDADLRDLLDSSFGDGPPPTPPADRLVPARRALRRRRMASGGLSLAAVAAAATVVALGVGPGAGTQAVGPAAGPLSTATPAPDPTPPDDGDDECATGEGAPPPGVLPTPADGAALDPVDDATSTCDDGIPVVPSPTGESPLVRFAGPRTERLVARGGASLVAQTADVTLPDNFAGPDDRTAVALVTAADGRTFVLARQVEGSRPEYIPFTDTRDRFPTIAAFLDFAEGKYAGEEGLR